MRKLLPLIFTLVILSATASQVHGQEAQGPQTFASFWAQFTAAVAKNDKEAVANMTKFPVLIADDLTREVFLQKYPKIFNQKARGCFAKKKPVVDKDGGYTLFCGDIIFVFEKVDGKYQFTSTSPND